MLGVVPPGLTAGGGLKRVVGRCVEPTGFPPA